MKKIVFLLSLILSFSTVSYSKDNNIPQKFIATEKTQDKETLLLGTWTIYEYIISVNGETSTEELNQCELKSYLTFEVDNKLKTFDFKANQDPDSKDDCVVTAGDYKWSLTNDKVTFFEGEQNFSLTIKEITNNKIVFEYKPEDTVDIVLYLIYKK